MNKGLEKLKELRLEADKYDGCLKAWSDAMGYKNYQAFFDIFRSKRLSERHLKALDIGATTIKRYREAEKEALEKVESMLS